MKRELGIARCGLACCLCFKNETCKLLLSYVDTKITAKDIDGYLFDVFDKNKEFDVKLFKRLYKYKKYIEVIINTGKYADYAKCLDTLKAYCNENNIMLIIHNVLDTVNQE